MNFNDLDELEQLAVLQALYNAVGEKVSTKNPDSLRARIDEQYRELYEQTGSKSFDVKLLGDVVGTYSIRFSKDKASETKLIFEVQDHEKLARWLDSPAIEQVAWEFVALNLSDFAEYYFTSTGEMPDGCDIRKQIIPAVDKAYMGGALKVDGESVANAIDMMLPGVAGLIAGENDERYL